MIDFLTSLHPVSIMGGSSIFIGLILMMLLRYNQLGYEKASFKGTSQKTKTWSSISIFSKTLIILGILLFSGGFALSKWETASSKISENYWYGKWNVDFCGDDEIEKITYCKFSSYTHKTDKSHQFCAELFDAENQKIAEMFRLKEGLSDFKNIKGTFKISQSAWIVEMSLLSDGESFTGVLRKKDSSVKVLLHGKKI